MAHNGKTLSAPELEYPQRTPPCSIDNPRPSISQSIISPFSQDQQSRDWFSRGETVEMDLDNHSKGTDTGSEKEGEGDQLLSSKQAVIECPDAAEILPSSSVGSDPDPYMASSPNLLNFIEKIFEVKRIPSSVGSCEGDRALEPVEEYFATCFALE